MTIVERAGRRSWRCGLGAMALIALAMPVLAAGASEITFRKPVMRWLWGGLGFHNSEATMLPIMSDEFRDERVLKTFREIAPTYSRVFAGYADWTKGMMDSFADYYDLTFRQAGTTLYMVPGRFPYVDKEFDARRHFDAIAANCAYLVKERKLTKLRYYAIANELSAGNVCAWLCRQGKMDLYREYCELMYLAFKRQGLDIGLQTADGSCGSGIENTIWATKNVDEFTDTYCWHHYEYAGKPGDRSIWDNVYTNVARLVQAAGRCEKRLSLGEFGYQGRSSVERRGYGSGVMRDDGNFSFRHPEDQAVGALVQVEMAFAAMNAGAVSAVHWTMFDYPDPFLREDGDSAAEKARYDVVRFSGHGLTMRYNKCGLIRWNDDDHDYSARDGLYTMGYAAKFFRKGGRILPYETADADLRAAAITNPDGSATFAVLNWGGAKDLRVVSEQKIAKPLRVYLYDSAQPPRNAFNDLQPCARLVTAKDNSFSVALPPKSLVFLTTDYVDRTPSAVAGVRAENGRLVWNACGDAEHVYYRVFSGGRQIASTVALSCALKGDGPFVVKSVDRWGNVEK